MAESSSLEAAFDTPDTKRVYVRRMFGTIAPKYDVFTRLFSYGRDRHWKTQMLDLLNLQAGERVLDLACGTGDLALESAKRGGRVTGLDLTTGMVVLASAKPSPAERPLAWLVGDMGALPLAPASFDAVTTGYGLRNVPDLTRAIGEIFRTLKPGGRMGSLDFDKPDVAWIRAIFLAYMEAAGGLVGWLFHRDADTYRYIAASIRRYPGSNGVADMMRAAGFVDVKVIELMGGFMAIHLATKPAPTADALRSRLDEGQRELVGATRV
jgi:demethylmenaquinone methyltransferase/2-methoxy-6-polyprenyl-1,4-benzoquinol methylase